MAIPALTQLALDAVAAVVGRVQAGDGVRVAHPLKMRLRAANREPDPLGMDQEDDHHEPSHST